MNSNCSAGTGSFLEEQISRLKLKLEDYALYAGRAKTIPRIAGRCSVFAKTDIIHHQQEGVPVEDILWGLACAMVRNYRGAVMRKLPLRKPILFAGGVAHNQAIISAFIEILYLREDEFIVPEHFAVIGALGAAIMANKENCPLNVNRLLMALEQTHDFIDARFDDYKSFDWNADYTQRVLNNFEGNTLPYAPRYTYNLGAHYRMPIGIYVRAELFGTDGFYGEAANLSEQKAYELVSARCGYEWKGVDLCLWMENVFDTEYLTTIKWKKSGIVGLDGPPRSLGVQLTWRY